MYTVQGILQKMSSRLGSPVEYDLVLGEHSIPLNGMLRKKMQWVYLGGIYCIQCGRKTSKSFQQGYCYPCMKRLYECGNCLIFPERCQVEKGKCPCDDWAHRQCNSSQIVYLANTSGLKVGITRKSHILTRWIDQGAVQAVPIFEASNRYRSGLVEVILKKFVSDRTNWRVMLKNEQSVLDIFSQRDLLLKESEAMLSPLLNTSKNTLLSVVNPHSQSIEYPVIEYPKKITTLSFDKQAEIAGRLMGIKGQYLILDTGVLNMRKFGGYMVQVTIQ